MMTIRHGGYDADERDDSDRCFETSAQYCDRYMKAVEQLDADAAAAAAAASATADATADATAAADAAADVSGCDQILTFKHSCGQQKFFLRYCWLYAKVMRIVDDDAWIQVIAPTHRRYYNVHAAEAQGKQSAVAVARISLKKTQARFITEEEQPSSLVAVSSDYSYHPSQSAPPAARKRRGSAGTQRRVSAAMVLMTASPPKLSPKQRIDDDINIDFDFDFAFESGVKNAAPPDPLDLDFDICGDATTEEEDILALFNAAVLQDPAAPAAASDSFHSTSEDDEDLYITVVCDGEAFNQDDDDLGLATDLATGASNHDDD
jgi:hypothetical protein